MTSSYDSLTLDTCGRCQYQRELVTIESGGQEYDLCRNCATRIQARRAV